METKKEARERGLRLLAEAREKLDEMETEIAKITADDGGVTRLKENLAEARKELAELEAKFKAELEAAAD